MVPKEPTPEMLAAVKGWTATVLVAEDDTAEYPVSEDECAEIYRNMLAAAPPASAEPVAWASSDPKRLNQLLSAAQYRSCAPKNRVGFDVPLYAAPPVPAAAVEVTEAATALVAMVLADQGTHMSVYTSDEFAALEAALRAKVRT